MPKYPTLTFSKWDFIAGLKCFLVSEKYYPLLKRGVEKVESRIKLFEIVETKCSSSTRFKRFLVNYHFDGFILLETPNPFVNTHSLSCFDGWGRRVLNATPNALFKNPVGPILLSAWSTLFWLHKFSQVYSFPTQKTVCIEFPDIGSHLRHFYHRVFCLANRIME